MKQSQIEKPLLVFSTPDSLLNTVTVFRVLPDNSTEPIGEIYPDLSNGKDSLIHISTNNQGEDLLPPTADFIEIEEMFRNYAKELSKKSFIEDMKAEAEKTTKREDSIKNIRKWKLNNMETQQISKS
jgi:hypothetical protein